MLLFRKEKEWLEKVEALRSGGQGPMLGCLRHEEGGGEAGGGGGGVEGVEEE